MSKYAQEISEIGKAVVRIETTLEEGVIKRLDKLNGTQEQQWTKINRNAEDQVELKTRMNDHCGNPDIHRGPSGEEPGGVKAARIQASSAKVVAAIAGLSSVLATGLTLLITHLF